MSKRQSKIFLSISLDKGVDQDATWIVCESKTMVTLTMAMHF